MCPNTPDVAEGTDIFSSAEKRTRVPPVIAKAGLRSIASPPLAAEAPSVTTAASCAGVELCAHDDPAEIEHEWKALEREGDCTVFQSFDWLAIWQKHIGARKKTIPAIVTGRDGGGRLLFILQLAVETQGLARRLTWLGSELCDYNAPLLAPDFSGHSGANQFPTLWRDILALLRSDRRFQFDFVDLQKMPEAVGGQRNPFLDLPRSPHPSGAYVATLGSAWEQFYAAKRSASTRKRERRQFKHLAEFGKVGFVNLQDIDEIACAVEVLIEQKRRSLTRMGVEDLFARPGYRDFYREIAVNPGTRALAHVSRLDVGQTVAAVSLGLTFRDCYYLVLSSYHDGEFSRFGPGRAHLHELLRHAIDNGYRLFDFTVGDEPYKRDWSDTEVRLHDHLAAATMRGRAMAALTAAFRRTKRLIKQNPVLWRAFSKVRVIAGAVGR